MLHNLIGICLKVSMVGGCVNQLEENSRYTKVRWSVLEFSVNMQSRKYIPETSWWCNQRILWMFRERDNTPITKYKSCIKHIKRHSAISNTALLHQRHFVQYWKLVMANDLKQMLLINLLLWSKLQGSHYSQQDLSHQLTKSDCQPKTQHTTQEFDITFTALPPLPCSGLHLLHHKLCQQILQFFHLGSQYPDSDTENTTRIN